jgi:hypothetical protein
MAQVADGDVASTSTSAPHGICDLIEVTEVTIRTKIPVSYMHDTTTGNDFDQRRLKQRGSRTAKMKPCNSKFNSLSSSSTKPSLQRHSSGLTTNWSMR